MSRHYQELDEPFIDYDLVEIEGVSQTLRGPAVDLDQPYVACIGAAQTFGRFCAHPYPAKLRDALGIPVFNLAIGGTGPAFYRRPALLRILRGAEIVVAQLLSGRSASNSEFQTDGGIEGVITSTGARGRFEPVLREFLATKPKSFIERIATETRADYIAQYRALLAEIGRPTILFWFAARQPDYTPGFRSMFEVMGGFPHFVDGPTLAAIKEDAAAHVECVSDRGLPQRLWQALEAVEGTRRGEDGFLYNDYYPTQEMHDDAVTALTDTCRSVLRARLHGRPAPVAALPSGPSPNRRPTWFVIVCAERTGSNLLLSMLRSHPEIGAAGEIFNGRSVDAPIPWPPVRERDDLVELRRRDKTALLAELGQIATQRGLAAFGFKLMYGQAERNFELVDFLRGIPGLCVIHIKRRNRLRRLVSHERAQLSDKWSRSVAERPVEQRELPVVDLDFETCVQDYLTQMNKEQMIELTFASQPMHEVLYESLERDPQAVGDGVLEFLDLPRRALKPGQRKTGTDTLRAATRDIDGLKAGFEQWLTFFDD